MKHYGKLLTAGTALVASILISGCNMNQVSNPMPYERNIAEVEDLLKQKAFAQCRNAVSYTHLTLPTILLV